MNIFTPKEIKVPVFDDYLEPLDQTTRRENRTKAMLGRPEWWFMKDVFEKSWKPPQGDDTYLLVRLSCSLETFQGQEVQDMTLTTNLCCQNIVNQPIAFDLFPREVKEETQTDLTVSIGPKLKIDKIEGSLGSVGGTIHFSKIEPVVIASNIGRSNPTWFFQRHRRHPLVGSRTVYLIVAYPSVAQEMQLSVKLMATVADRFGPIRIGIPEKAQDNLIWPIP